MWLLSMWLTNLFVALSAVLVVPLMFINFGAFPVAGIALGINGEWSLIFWGIGAMVALPFVYAIAAVPNMGIVLAANWLFERKGAAAILAKPLAILFSVIGLSYSVALMWVIVVGVFALLPPFAGIAPQQTDYFYAYFDWKILLWCYAIATSPFSYMASKGDSGDMATTNAVFFVQLLALLFLTGFFLGWNQFLMAMLTWIWFAAVIVIQGVLAIEQWRER